MAGCHDGYQSRGTSRCSRSRLRIDSFANAPSRSGLLDGGVDRPRVAACNLTFGEVASSQVIEDLRAGQRSGRRPVASQRRIL
jgi:hypothetical protein